MHLFRSFAFIELLTSGVIVGDDRVLLDRMRVTYQLANLGIRELGAMVAARFCLGEAGSRGRDYQDSDCKRETFHLVHLFNEERDS
jgi:hypothetical protein